MWTTLSTVTRRPRVVSAGGYRPPTVALPLPKPDLPDMTVAGETARGYLLNGRVLRPAMVTVAMAPDDRDAGSNS